MVKIFFLIACLIVALNGSSASTNIECEYVLNDYIVFGSTYYCNVLTNPNIVSTDSAQISMARGIHKDKKTNDDVFGIHMKLKTVKIFPQNLEKVFKNLNRIHINNCKLEEIHQSDLKSIPNLTHFYTTANAIEVVEEGLFDFNPKLVWVGINEAKIIHIDPNVFDNLSGLSSFWFSEVFCIKKLISDSRPKVIDAINLSKVYCVSPEYVALDEKIKALEKETNSEDFRAKLENFEKGFKNSTFSKYRPLNYKFEGLKNQTIDSPVTQPTTTKQPEQNCPKVPENVNSEAVCKAIGVQLSDNLENISGRFDDFKETQKLSQQNLSESINKLTAKVNDLKSRTESSQDDIKSSISDTESSLSSIKSSQNELKASINKLKNSQNEIAILLNEIKDSKNENSEDKIAAFAEKLENFEAHLFDLEVKNAEKFDKIEKEFANTRHLISINFDEKIKGVEKRLMKKFEEVLEKLGPNKM